MPDPRTPAPDEHDEIALLTWTVQPSLNRLLGEGSSVRLEPKWMDVLCLLLRFPGQVLSKETIAQAVWPDTFISDSVITRAIAGLRKALGDDARAPRYIETIAKRGYRLLPLPHGTTSEALAAPAPGAREVPAAEDSRPPGPAPAATFDASPMTHPFTVGQWVRGSRFYGRKREIREALDGPRNGLWLLGGRAVGKTSFLKQLEHLTASDPDQPYFPLFWDLQGSEDPADLNADFLDAMREAEQRLEALGLQTDTLEGKDLFATLGRLRRALRSRGRTLLLLWDEVEELIHLHRRAPALLRKLRRALQAQEGIRTVMASSYRLWKLAEQRDDTSPFLHGFAPPIYLGPLKAEAARQLVVQDHDAGLGGIAAGDETVAEILRESGNHPALLQALCAGFLACGNLEQARRAVATDPTVRFFFEIDFDLLSELEQDLLVSIAESGSPVDQGGLTHGAALPGAAAPESLASLLHLRQLGMVRALGDDRIEIASPIFGRWLREEKGR